ncbi:hypothetical protein [Clostridium sp. LCP25S3_F8]|uniref:hypothetical protein n=1 Tax=Clostridium sp. LCP25S3_F8 TaxID=3438751 RepID=UPI003F8F2A09
MTLTISNKNLNGLYPNNINGRINKNKSISFQDQLDKINQNTNKINNYCDTSKTQAIGVLSYSPFGKINNISNNFILSDEQQSLIEDRFIYDKFELKNEGIEFNSENFKSWKKEHYDVRFPPLDAPANVRKYWRELEESVADDPVASAKIEDLEAYLGVITHYPDEFGYPKDFDSSTTKSYHTLLNLVVNKYMDFYNFRLEQKYLDFANTVKDVSNNLQKYL